MTAKVLANFYATSVMLVLQMNALPLLGELHEVRSTQCREVSVAIMTD